ncbi:hypothetical protein [Sphingomonas japonica]|uniref:Heme exporter protein D n=1 Tax=Sphingomonas japonica TaxID=511662 RepID=A0ABX0TZ59_9SPHN|nr:hypothetical protein [Sphingomonas japonica]NIJ22776.1 hypothetical protein [Sphingomonas japonica]
MNQWAFVIAAYAVTLAATGAIAWGSYAAMRRAERAAEELTRR